MTTPIPMRNGALASTSTWTVATTTGMTSLRATSANKSAQDRVGVLIEVADRLHQLGIGQAGEPELVGEVRPRIGRMPERGATEVDRVGEVVREPFLAADHVDVAGRGALDLLVDQRQE